MARFLKLDRIEILGFKSFYGRTKFEFPAGITAVVGPNGCGKSNIGDAISWVLGEQRASSLRSDRMEDVIFNGSDARKALGMAEVSLHFGNITPRAEPAVDPLFNESADGGIEIEGTGGNGRGNARGGNGRGGNGHGTLGPEGDALLDEIEVGIPLITDAPAVEDGPTAPPAEAGPEPQERGAESGGSRFFLEDLPQEVVVTRRLYRSGESEYILNGRRCRLREIQDLLSRAEIGTRLYVTIEQGRIDQILAAKPKERRGVIEEAAGILGYKAKRRQAELKLEAAQANLLRIADITSEVEKQINSLRRQASKARRYRRLVEELREQRRLTARRQLLALDEDERATEEALRAMRANDAATAAAVARQEADLEALRAKLEDGEEALRKRRDEIHALDIEIDRLQGRIRGGEEQRDDLAQRIGEAEREAAALEVRLKERERQREEIGARLEEGTERVRCAESALEATELTRRDRTDHIGSRENELERSRGDLMRQMDALSDMLRRRTALDEQIRASSEALDRLDREAAELATALEAITGVLEVLRRKGADVEVSLAERAAARETLLGEEREIADRVAAAERHFEERKGRLAALRERRQVIEDLERQRAGYAEGVAEILRGDVGFEPHGVVGEKIEIPAGLEGAVAATLGDLCEALMVDSLDEAERGVAHLRRGSSGRTAFVRAGEAHFPAERSVPEGLAGRPGVLGLLRGQITGLADGGPVDAALSRTVLVAELAQAIELQASHPGWTFVTSQGDIVRQDGSVAGGDGPELHHGVLARRAESAEIRGQMAVLEDDVKSTEARITGMREEESRARQLLEAATRALQEEEREGLQTRFQLQQKEAERERLREAMARVRAEREQIERQRECAENELGASGPQLESAEGIRDELEGKIRAAAGDLTLRRSELDEVQRQVAELRASVAAGKQRLSDLVREREALEEGLEETKSRLELRQRERTEWRARIGDIVSQESSLRESLQRALESRAAGAARDEAAAAGLAYDRSLLHSREQTVKETRAAHAELRGQLQERELRQARLVADLEHLERMCREDLSISIDELRSVSPEEERSLEDLEAEVARLKSTLETMGPVNLMAIEQCSDLEERFQFLSLQKKDLEDSIASLRETIRRINRESRQRFNAAFEAIQAGFQHCFATLFGGGRAELRLQDGEEDVLEAGIEMVAQPPGKRLQSITLLSGGERALTAVALLFALFRYRPSPFCVLDEVDAPLDEANVERFTRLLQELTNETQFILITHNRKSMEAADLLYGITMEEPGVSKVLPLRFE